MAAFEEILKLANTDLIPLIIWRTQTQILKIFEVLHNHFFVLYPLGAGAGAGAERAEDEHLLF